MISQERRFVTRKRENRGELLKLRLDGEVQAPAVAQHQHQRGLLGPQAARHLLKVAQARGRLAVDFGDDVADLETRLASRTAVGDAGYNNTAFVVSRQIE